MGTKIPRQKACIPSESSHGRYLRALTKTKIGEEDRTRETTDKSPEPH